MPQPSHRLVELFWGYVHRLIRQIGIRYNRRHGIESFFLPYFLPFGLILKWTDRLRLDEILTTKLCRAAGLPAPLVLNYGYHKNDPKGKYSYLMVRLPGKGVGEIWDSLTPEAKATVSKELKMYLDAMRAWKSPWGDDRICSLLGNEIWSHRVPDHLMGPFENLDELHDHMLGNVVQYGPQTVEEYLPKASPIRELHRRRPVVKFTHGDVAFQNILIDQQGHITGLIDWEGAGWLPEYWEYTTATMRLRKDGFVIKVHMAAGADQYLEELECERALWSIQGILCL